ncbi:MAG: SemiSWEET transporter [Thermodesulfobacteriota bacterium]
MKFDPVTLLGLVAAGCTTFSFVPQVIKTIRSGHAKDISLAMYAVLSLGLFLWLVYGIILGDLPLIVANSISCTLSCWVLVLKLRHG